MQEWEKSMPARKGEGLDFISCPFPMLHCSLVFHPPVDGKENSSGKMSQSAEEKSCLWTAEASEKQNLKDLSRRLGISSLIGGAGVSSCVSGQVLITSDFYRQPALQSFIDLYWPPV